MYVVECMEHECEKIDVEKKKDRYVALALVN